MSEYKVVPVEPTDAMLDAAEKLDWADEDVRANCLKQWYVMLAAAPTEPGMVERLELADTLADLLKRCPEGPYFLAGDAAHDAPDHENSGLALIDTGRHSDWPMARLMENHSAHLIWHLLNNAPALIAALRRPQPQATQSDELTDGEITGWYQFAYSHLAPVTKGTLAGIRKCIEIDRARRSALAAPRQRDAVQDVANKACSELPEFYSIRLCMELGAGWVELEDPSGEMIELDTDDIPIAQQIENAIVVAASRAPSGAK